MKKILQKHRKKMKVKKHQDLTLIEGIGDKYQFILKEAGFDNIQDVALARPTQLPSVIPFKEFVIEDAQDLIRFCDSPFFKYKYIF